MERAVSQEERIRRAEEIYYKRKEQEIPMRETIRRTPREKKNIKLFRKMIRQIIVCLIIYGIFYLIVNNNYIFSADFTNKAKEILSQDINFAEVYSMISNKVVETYNKIVSSENSDNKEEQQSENTNNEDSNDQNTETQVDTTNNDENIGGAEEILAPIEENDAKELSQMEQDANYIKSTISFIKPINGKISSAFGWRNPTTETVPKNHTGTDIAAETGTKIISATDGNVTLSSTTGDYGKHIKVQINDVVIVYAHCSKLYVNEGDTIKQGQEIAEVGSTRKCNRPTFAF